MTRTVDAGIRRAPRRVRRAGYACARQARRACMCTLGRSAAGGDGARRDRRVRDAPGERTRRRPLPPAPRRQCAVARPLQPVAARRRPRPSVIDPDAFGWTDANWRGSPRTARDLRAARRHVHAGRHLRRRRGRLPDLRDLGITAIELMPVADFPGSRNWGYDGVACSRRRERYGRPDDLRALVDARTRRARRHPGRRLQPPRAGRQLPARRSSRLSSPTATHAVGRGDQSRRRRAAAQCVA